MVIISFILVTLMCDLVVLLKGEIRCLSPLEDKGLLCTVSIMSEISGFITEKLEMILLNDSQFEVNYLNI